VFTVDDADSLWAVDVSGISVVDDYMLVGESAPQIEVADNVDLVGLSGEEQVTILINATVIGLGAVIDDSVDVLRDLEVVIAIPINFVLVDDTSSTEGPVHYVEELVVDVEADSNGDVKTTDEDVSIIFVVFGDDPDFTSVLFSGVV